MVHVYERVMSNRILKLSNSVVEFREHNKNMDWTGHVGLH